MHKELKNLIGLAVSVGLAAGVVAFLAWGVNYGLSVSQNGQLAAGQLPP